MVITAAEYIKLVSQQRTFGDLLVHEQRTPARHAQTKRLGLALSLPVRNALSDMGIDEFYTHQVHAIEAVSKRENVIISTSTASGKSLCYTVPIVEKLAEAPSARALMLFPTKALGYDQIKAFNAFTAKTGRDIRARAYDGDTPRSERSAIRKRERVVVSNADMLAYSILPQHQYWSDFLSNLEYIVIDEAHYYRGVLGSHLAMLCRRLRRILAHYGSNPTFIFCSATLSNARDHAEALTGLPFNSVERDGSPAGSKAFFNLNPSAIDDELSINARSGALVAGLMLSGIKSLTFVSNRSAAERVVQYAQQSLQDAASDLSMRGSKGDLLALKDRIKPYRAGYLPDYRRETENAIKRGELLAIVSTTAMELGVNIGALDAVVLTGYPGTIASFRQQAGRAGRQGEESVVLTLLKDTPVDQFYAHNPDSLFNSPTEFARVSLDNPNIVKSHLLCAARELPLSSRDFVYFGEESLVKNCADLTRRGDMTVYFDRTRRTAAHIRNPAYDLNIRGLGNMQQVSLIDQETGEVLEIIDWTFALRELYPDAIYSHKGTPFKVTHFDAAEMKAYARCVYSYEYTTRVSETLVTSVDTDDDSHDNLGQAPFAGVADRRVSERVIGYRVQHMYKSSRNVEAFVEVEDMPPLTFGTKVFWISPDPNHFMPVSLEQNLAGALHALAHLLRSSFATLAMCDPSDLSDAVMIDNELFPEPSALIYENHEGGVGIVDYASTNQRALLERAELILNSCKCANGCPSCIESALCFSNSDLKPSSKRIVRMLLDVLLRPRPAIGGVRGLEGVVV